MRSGVILAGGDGSRLRGFIHRLRGDALPKQFVPFWGVPSMYQRTLNRAKMVIHSDRLYTVVGRHHLEFPEAAGQVKSRPPGTVVVQPQNRETCPGLLLPLVHLAARDPDATVVAFPSDHFIAEETRFMSHVEQACRAVERDGSRLVLVGAVPHAPEPEYGYIVAGPPATDRADEIRPVIRFVEKPPVADAVRLIRDGALWNTFVMVVRLSTIFALVRWCAPGLYHSFLEIGRAIGTRREQDVTESVYRTLAPLNFSRGVLEPVARHDPRRLAVVPARGVFWSDCGSEERLLADWNRAWSGRPLRPSSVAAISGRARWAERT